MLDSFCPLDLLVQCSYKWPLWWSMRYQNNQFPSTFFYEVRQKNKWNLDAEEKWCTASGKQMACESFCSQKVEKMCIAFIARSSAVSQMPGAMGSFSPENKWVLEEQLLSSTPFNNMGSTIKSGATANNRIIPTSLGSCRNGNLHRWPHINQLS